LRYPFGATNRLGSIYFSFVYRVDTLGTFSSVGTLAGFVEGTSSTLFGTKINIRTNGFGEYNLGTSKAGGVTFGGWAPNNFDSGEAVLVVGRYTFNPGTADDTCDLWLNPDASTFGANEPPPAIVANVGAGGTDLVQIDRFFLRAGGTTTSPIKQTADELRIGTSWASVTPKPSVTPPTLVIAREENDVVVSWAASASGFLLEAATSLVVPNWTQLSFASDGTTNSFRTIPGETAQFFRLRK
jgi:hypothetical protein